MLDAKKDLKNNGDLYSLTQPDVIGDIHRRFLEAGADIIETNTFSATSIGQSEFFVDDPREHGGRKNPSFIRASSKTNFSTIWPGKSMSNPPGNAVQWCDRIANQTGRPRFVAGAIGPLTVSLSNSPDADDAGFRVCTFDQVKAAYLNQIRALIAGGSDLLLVETIFDSLNAKAALVAIQEVFEQDKKVLPIMISAAVGRGGRDDDFGADHRGFLERDEACQTAGHRLELLARPGLDAAVSRGAGGEIRHGHLVLSERGSAQSAVADGL